MRCSAAHEGTTHALSALSVSIKKLTGCAPSAPIEPHATRVNRSGAGAAGPARGRSMDGLARSATRTWGEERERRRAEGGVRERAREAESAKPMARKRRARRRAAPLSSWAGRAGHARLSRPGLLRGCLPLSIQADREIRSRFGGGVALVETTCLAPLPPSVEHAPRPRRAR